VGSPTVSTAEADRAAIRATGQLAANATWQNTMASPAQIRSRASELVEAPGSIREEIARLPQRPLTYACARYDDAAFYARRTDGLPVVISFEVPLEEVAIDGKDFLYTVFQFWDREDKGHFKRVRTSLASLFGPAILPWFDLARRESDTMARIGLCDLATHDLAAVEAHYGNEIGIAGRHGTRFRSAFAVPATVDPATVVSVTDVGSSFDLPPSFLDIRELLSP
jgi:hypothetical protein